MLLLSRVVWILHSAAAFSLRPQLPHLGSASALPWRRRVQVTSVTEEAARSEIGRRNDAINASQYFEWESNTEGRAVAVEAATSSELSSFNLVVERFLQTAEDIWGGEPKPPVRGRRIVILGSGWGAGEAALYDRVTVISPRNYFLFTPMLAGAAVGTVEYRSITEPLRRLNAHVDYLEATATRIDFDRRHVECEAVVCEGTSCEIGVFEVAYDVLVCGVGATTNTFGVPGVREHCLFLKQVQDAEALRRAVGNALERANLPTVTEHEKWRTLSFVVVGAGPTGVEFCSELIDFLQAEATRYYPELLRYVRVTLLEATGTVLSAFDASLRDVALAELRRERVAIARSDSGAALSVIAPVDVRLGAAVKMVNESHVIVGDDGLSIPYGVCVWAGGNAPVRVVSESIDAIGDLQTAAQSICRGRFAVDAHLRVLGTPRGEAFALGDCAAYAPRPLPATAQVAAQQGEYLARLLISRYNTSEHLPSRADSKRTLGENFCNVTDDSRILARGFQFLDLGILTYLGDSKALAQVSIGQAGPKIKGAGRVTFGLWCDVSFTITFSQWYT